MKQVMITATMLMMMSGVAGAADKATMTTGDTTGMMNCGEKMKALIPLPTKFEELMTSVSNNMSAHAKTMSMQTDKNSQAEAKVVKMLAADHKVVADQMKKIVKDMEAAGKLAPAPHDMTKTDTTYNENMLTQARLEREMAALMIQDAEKTEKMIETMKNASVKK